MSNNNYDYIESVKEIVNKYPQRVLGVVTQHRINLNGLINMTPGISKSNLVVGDQKYRTVKDVDTDIVIVGRGIYESDNYMDSVKMYLIEATI